MRRDDVWRKQLVACAESYGRMLYRLAWNILRDSQAADDACQQALMKACAGMCDSREDRAIQSWLARTVVNEAIGELRRRKRQDRLLRARFTPVDARCGERSNPALCEMVSLGLERLEPQMRDVVVMRIMEGRSGEEVAEVLHTSQATVSRRLQDAMTRLRSYLNTESEVASARDSI